MKEIEKRFFDGYDYNFNSEIIVFDSSKILHDYCDNEIFSKKDSKNTIMYMFPSIKGDYNKNYHFTFLEGDIVTKKDRTICSWVTYHCYPNEKAMVKTKSEVIINAL